ncbi:hypothetical protein MMC07_008059 [Pseudocyphellaria aurata]|nr:hypothetical protein [Pseudocyphellaria aurata]
MKSRKRRTPRQPASAQYRLIVPKPAPTASESTLASESTVTSEPAMASEPTVASDPTLVSESTMTSLTHIRPAKKCKFHTTTSALWDAQQLLIHDVQTKVDASASIPPTLNDQTSYRAIQSYQTYTDAAIAGEQDIFAHLVDCS